MRAILLIFSAILSFSAFGDARTPTEKCIEHLLRDGEGIQLRFNDLVITDNDRIFWKGDPVLLEWTNHTPIRNREPFIQLLSVLVKNPYKVFSPRELFDSAWDRGDFDLRAVSQPLFILRMNFERVDPGFNALKNLWRKGYMWDDGKNDVITYYDVPEIQIFKSQVVWRGEPVNLSQSQRDIVKLLLDKRGAAVPEVDLYNIGREQKVEILGKKETAAFKVKLSVIRKAFRVVDKDFDRFKSTDKGTTRTWIVERAQQHLDAAE